MEKIPCYYAYDGLVIVNEHVSDLTTIFLQLKQNQIHPTLALTYFDSINVMKIHHYFSISGLLGYEKRFLFFWTSMEVEEGKFLEHFEHVFSIVLRFPSNYVGCLNQGK